MNEHQVKLIEDLLYQQRLYTEMRVETTLRLHMQNEHGALDQENKILRGLQILEAIRGRVHKTLDDLQRSSRRPTE